MRSPHKDLKKSNQNIYSALIGLSVLIPLLCFAFLYFNSWIIKFHPFKEYGLFSFEIVSTTVLIGLTFTSTVFFIFNFIQQKNQFQNQNEASVKANDLQIVLFEKKTFIEEYNYLKDDFKVKDVISQFQKDFTSLEEILKKYSRLDEKEGHPFTLEIATSTILIDKNNEKEKLLKFIINQSNRISILNKELNTPSAIEIFITSFPSELIELLKMIFLPTVSKQILEFNFLPEKGKSEEVLFLLREIVRDAEDLKRLISKLG